MSDIQSGDADVDRSLGGEVHDVVPDSALSPHEPHIASAPANDRSTRRKWMLLGLAVPFTMLALLVTQAMSSRGDSQSATVIEPSREVPLLNNALTDYRQVTSGDVPERSLDLDIVRAVASVPFDTISHPSVHFVRAWTTSLSGEPVAVVAYRWKDDRLVLQYIVREALLLQSTSIRASIATQRPLSLKDGAQGVYMWAEPQYGTILVGDFEPRELGELRGWIGSR